MPSIWASKSDSKFVCFLSAKNNLELPRDDWNELKDNPLKQNTGPDPRKWNCGAALATFGSRYAEHHYTSGGRLYYRTPSPPKLSEVKFKADVVRDGVQKIRTRLKNGNFVQVFVGHHEHLTVSSDGVIQPSGNTHYITLFGASQDGKEFLYFDPWPQGSMMTYQSGIMGSVHLIFAGIITFFEDEGKIRTRDSAPGLHKYVILTGP